MESEFSCGAAVPAAKQKPCSRDSRTTRTRAHVFGTCFVAVYAVSATAINKQTPPTGTSKIPGDGSTSVCVTPPRKKPNGNKINASRKKNDVALRRFSFHEENCPSATAK